MEVVRKDDVGLAFTLTQGQSLEGRNNYGCWFYPAIGSGILINLGRSLGIYWKKNYNHVEAAWRVRYGASNVTDLARVQNMPHGERFPLQAADLGYDTVFVRNNLGYDSGEIVVLNRGQCMVNQRKLRSCTPMIDVRTWAGRGTAGSCRCDDGLASFLSCDGVGYMNWLKIHTATQQGHVS